MLHIRSRVGTDHTQAHSLVAVHEIAEVFAGSGHRDTLAVTEFVESTVHAQVGFPVLTVSYILS